MGGIVNTIELEGMWKEASRPRHAKTEGSAETLVPAHRASRCNVPVDRKLFNKSYYSGIHLERLRKMTTSVRKISTQAEISTCGFPNTKLGFTYLTATLSRNF